MKDREIGKVDVDMFDRRGCGPWPDELHVNANVDPSPNYPVARIYLGSKFPDQLGESRDFGAACLTIQAARMLATMLTAAADAAAKACPDAVLG
jgi:hypothetical protein